MSWDELGGMRGWKPTLGGSGGGDEVPISGLGWHEAPAAPGEGTGLQTPGKNHHLFPAGPGFGIWDPARAREQWGWNPKTQTFPSQLEHRGWGRAVGMLVAVPSEAGTQRGPPESIPCHIPCQGSSPAPSTENFIPPSPLGCSFPTTSHARPGLSKINPVATVTQSRDAKYTE